MDPSSSPPENPPPSPPSELEEDPSASPPKDPPPSPPSKQEDPSFTEDEDDETGEHSHSLPTLEEARTEGVIAAGGSFTRGSGDKALRSQRRLALAGILVFSVALIVGFSVAISQNNKSNSSSGSFSSSGEDPLSNSRSISRFLDVQEFLAVDISSLSDLENNDKPQYKAALWIADQDKINNGDGMPLPDDPVNYDASYEFVQRYILAVMYFALDGPNWGKQVGFLSDKSVCGWNYPLDRNSAPDYADLDNWKYGVECTDGAVSRIFIPGNNITGVLPSEMGDLLDLEHLSLFKNNITGSFHQDFRYWRSITFIGLESNQLAGKLPTWINEWESLTYLALGDNLFTGELPDGMADLTLLEELALDDNDFSGSIDVLYNLKSLRNLYLGDNGFDSRIHDASFVGFESMEILDLSYNEFTGYFPVHFYNFLEVDLHSNYIADDLPPVPAAADYLSTYRMTYLSLYDNDMTGSIPPSLGVELKQMVTLDLSGNKLTGVIPDELSNMRKLESLYLSQNSFSPGPIPDLRDCRELRALSMTETSRDGYIHQWIGSSLSKLELLDLHDNALTGSIPTNFGELSNLILLFLQHNQLTGTFPSELANLPNIVSVFLQHNEITGTLDPVCDAQPDKLAFFVSDCLEDAVTCECCECCSSLDAACWDDPGRMDTLNEEPSRNFYLFSEDVIFVDSPSPLAP